MYTGRVTQARKISAKDSNKVSNNDGVGRDPQAFANLPRVTHPKIKAWLSRWGAGHEADNLSVEMLRTPKKDVKMVIEKYLTRPCR